MTLTAQRLRIGLVEPSVIERTVSTRSNLSVVAVLEIVPKTASAVTNA